MEQLPHAEQVAEDLDNTVPDGREEVEDRLNPAEQEEFLPEALLPVEDCPQLVRSAERLLRREAFVGEPYELAITVMVKYEICLIHHFAGVVLEAFGRTSVDDANGGHTQPTGVIKETSEPIDEGLNPLRSSDRVLVVDDPVVGHQAIEEDAFLSLLAQAVDVRVAPQDQLGVGPLHRIGVVEDEPGEDEYDDQHQKRVQQGPVERVGREEVIPRPEKESAVEGTHHRHQADEEAAFVRDTFGGNTGPSGLEFLQTVAVRANRIRRSYDESDQQYLQSEERDNQEDELRYGHDSAEDLTPVRCRSNER